MEEAPLDTQEYGEGGQHDCQAGQLEPEELQTVTGLVDRYGCQVIAEIIVSSDIKNFSHIIV